MPQTNLQLEEAVRLAREAAASGRRDDAERLWMQIFSVAPVHPEASLRLAQSALQRSDAETARTLLERAAAAASNDPMLALHLAVAHRTLGDEAGEAAALEAALKADPYCYPALLLKGAMLERQGDMRHAARIFGDALKIVPQDGSLSPDLRALVAQAQTAVRRNAEELRANLERDLAPLLAKHGNQKLDRFDLCKDVALGLKQVYVQQPALFHFPQLPAIQFYDRDQFGWMDELESRTAEIREEFLKVYAEDAAGFAPYVDRKEGAPVDQWAELNHSPRWSSLHLWRHGKPVEGNCARCPKTAAAVGAVPMIEMENYSPTVLFSLLAPHTRIPPHSSSTNVRLVVHLPLIVPKGCAFRVGSETREWQEGKAWVFDDTIEHEAWNDSGQLRVILMIDIWNPYLTGAERELSSALMNSIKNYYR